MEAAQPSNETERLKALAEYRLLDTEFEQAYDDITALLAHVCGCPIVLIGLIDERRQWFKSKIGIPTSENRRDQTFCQHAILQPDQMLVVDDATKDPRFADLPAVTVAGGVRFYAGMPLTTPDGLPLGTLCMADARPRQLSDEQLRVLRILARQVTSLFELRRATFNLAQALAKVKNLESLLPTCSYCKAIRDERGNWHSLETYLDERANVSLSHGICPECLTKRRAERLAGS